MTNRGYQDKAVVKDIADRRKVLLRSSWDTKTVNKGNKRIHSERHCAICGKTLVNYNTETGKYLCLVSHFDCTNEFFRFFLCLDSTSCNNELSHVGSNVE